MSDCPRVSVVTVAYNRADVLPAAIESVLAQSMPDLELILVDDASVDGTLEVMLAYSRLDERIQVVTHPTRSRGGPVEWEPRNDGLQRVRAPSVAYLDSDNTWRPRLLERLLEVLDGDPIAQLVHCNSCNHYPPGRKKDYTEKDFRRLIDEGPSWSVFSHDRFNLGQAGREVYVDTNEIVHRTSVFARLGYLWRTVHPRRDEVNAWQGKRHPYRRHNDLDLVERIAREFGERSIRNVPEVLVDFYYEGATRDLRPRLLIPTIPPLADSVIHPEMSSRLGCLNVSHFYARYLVPVEKRSPESEIRYDFGTAELSVTTGVDINAEFVAFSAIDGAADSAQRYEGTSTLQGLYERLATCYNGFAGESRYDAHAIAPFNGCHEAIYTALRLLVGSLGHPSGRDHFLYHVPSYPYWMLGAAASLRGVPVETHTAGELMQAIDNIGHSRIGAILLHFPANPVGALFPVEDLIHLGERARREGYGIVVDFTNHSFLDRDVRRQAMKALPSERTIFCDSLSKSWGLPGLRQGYAICANPDIAAALRALKSAASLLPSATMQRFFAHLLAHHPDLPDQISRDIRRRRNLLRECLEQGPLQRIGITWPADPTFGPYEVLYVDSLCVGAVTSERLAERLAADVGVRVLPAEGFFPPDWGRPRQPFLRLSVTRESRIAEGVEALTSVLVSMAA
jgi:valine--pyruvate aminotransferase